MGPGWGGLLIIGGQPIFSWKPKVLAQVWLATMGNEAVPLPMELEQARALREVLIKHASPKP